MTLPNKLTFTRIVMTPLFFIVFSFFYNLMDSSSGLYLCILLWIIYIGNEITDVLDGYFARKMNLVSELGKLLDPFSDVLSRVTYFICFFTLDLLPLAALIVIIWREFFIGFIRTLLVKEGITLAANKGGKLKAIFYFTAGLLSMATIQIGLMDNMESLHSIMASITWWMYVAAALSAAISFLIYCKELRKTKIWHEFFS